LGSRHPVQFPLRPFIALYFSYLNRHSTCRNGNGGGAGVVSWVSLVVVRL
jgi:hypothetical protein